VSVSRYTTQPIAVTKEPNKRGRKKNLKPVKVVHARKVEPEVEDANPQTHHHHAHNCIGIVVGESRYG
jgi:hypothetical protein